MIRAAIIALLLGGFSIPNRLVFLVVSCDTPNMADAENFVEKPPKECNADRKEGMILFRARLVLEGRYDTFKANVALAVKEKRVTHWGLSEHLTARQMGYVGYEGEKALALGSRKVADRSELVPPRLDAKADLDEAYTKFGKIGLSEADFVRPGAWFWYEQYQDPDLRKNVVQAVVNNMDKDRAVHRAMSEADRRLARWCFAVVGLIVSVSSIWQALHEVLK